MFDPLAHSSDFARLESDLDSPGAHISATGLTRTLRLLLTEKLLTKYRSILYITHDERLAGEYASEISAPSHLLPAKDLLFGHLNTRSRYLADTRLGVLCDKLAGEGGVYFASIDSIMDPLPSASSLTSSRLILRPGMRISPQELALELTGMGYERVAIVESTGQFAVRGGIADIYPIAQDEPLRLEWFGDEIESIRHFNTYSQRSTDTLSEAELYPAQCAEDASFPDYFGPESLIVVESPARVLERGTEIETELRESYQKRRAEGIDEPPPHIYPASRVPEETRDRRVLLFPTLVDDSDANANVYRFHTEAVGRYKGSYSLLKDALEKYCGLGYRLCLMTPSATRASRIAQELRDEGLRAYCPDENSGEQAHGTIEVVTGRYLEGYEWPQEKYVLMTEGDMYGRDRSRKRRGQGDAVRVGALSELKAGDYVVHETHGIGIYQGIEHIVSEEVGRDYLRIEYLDGGKLYLPVTRLDLIQKYSGAEGKKPALSRLGGAQWARVKERVARSTEQTARELVALYAARLSARGHRYEPDTEWQKEFEEMFPFEETPDQLAAIEDVKRDMESERVMDRLICGDVGYGKTEIAMRAAFKAASEGKQTAVLVPTTILADQHYHTFTERFQSYPIRIEVLSRFRDSAANKKTIEELRAGRIDIIIGTHRLLSDDVGFKDLGLLIVDEEQRFGVAHKEKIKKLKTNVEALSLTATPIPRTLHMSLAGIRDLSIIDEPPFDRVPIETYVLEYHDEYVREAAARELRRSGQVFYVYNRVRGIEQKCEKLRSLLPGASIECAHSQMPERELEDIMRRFMAGDIDILVSTTIVESGLDIPRANTIIVDGAEAMGLSQLYQLRGRVGRSGRTAYAFFMYRKDRILREEAEKRLSAIREFTGFGSGIKIAMRDLEIRGAGNVLGTEQHGDICAVGYELYVKLLGRAVREERGLGEKEEQFETTIDCTIDAYIPDSYIGDEPEKLEIYRRIALIEDEEARDALIDELTDRFGTPPEELTNLCLVALLRARAHRAYVTELTIREGSIVMRMYERAKIRVEAIPSLIESEEGALRLTTGKHPRFSYNERRGVRRDIRAMIEKTGEIIAKLTI